MKKALSYGAILIGIYLGVTHGPGLSGILDHGATGGTGVIKALQGR